MSFRVGDKIFWKGSRVAIYLGRVLLLPDENHPEYAVTCDENHYVHWVREDQFKAYPPVKETECPNHGQ